MSEHAYALPRAGSVFVAAFRSLDRNAIARVMFNAEALDRRTHTPGRHGGLIGRSGLAVLRTLAVRFLNKRTGQLDPSLETIAKAANLARSTVQEAIARLIAAGLIEKERRVARINIDVWHPLARRMVRMARLIQITNAYRINLPRMDGAEPQAALASARAQTPVSRGFVSDTGFRSETIPPFKSTTDALNQMQAGPLRDALERMQARLIERATKAKT
jgi:hypothetical protein